MPDLPLIFIVKSFVELLLLKYSSLKTFVVLVS